MDNPVYHLRPNKAVDRNLFIECLLRLRNVIELSEYRYIGFGSYEFDEFKLVYRNLGIEDLHSIEKDPDVFRRQNFNKPYSCISLFNETCGNYFDEDFDESKKSIIWADFSVANEKYAQCQDIANICSKIRETDILRITFNAQPTSIPMHGKRVDEVRPEDRKKLRFEALKEDLADYFPDGEDVCEDDITQYRYPLFLLKTIRRAVYKDLDVSLSPCPICSYVYSDHMQMMTVTIYMCSSDKEKRKKTVQKLENAYKGWESYVNLDKWDDLIKINLPPLTVHEQLEIGQYEKNMDGIKKIEEEMGIKEDELRRYLQFARYYPNFQPVII